MKYLGPPQSGSRADVVASRNQFGQYTRARTIPADPMTAAQGLARARMAACVAAWQALTDVERLAWILAETGRVSPIGVETGLTGFAFFCRVNLSINGPAGSVTVPPVAGPLVLRGFSVSTDPFQGLVVAAIQPAGAWIYATEPLSAGSMAAPGRSAATGTVAYFRRITFLGAGAWPNDVSAAYGSAFGPLAGGERVWVQAREVRAAGLGPRQRAFVVIG